MFSHDEKIPNRAGFFGDESEIFPEQNQKDVIEKQDYYENQIQKLYERIQSLSLKGTTDLNLLWAKTREFINFCNKAGEYFLKVELFDLAKGNFIKAKNSLEKFTANDIQSTTEWKALKIAVYRNLAQYYSKQSQSEKSLHLLKKILPLQQELQKHEILLPGAEFLYISMGDLACKLKAYQEAANYAELGVKLLEKQLSIESNTLQNFESADWPQILKDPKVQMVRARKFIALSYLSYLSGKANQSLGKNLVATNHYEKAAIISTKFLGPENKITVSYTKKYESMLQMQKQMKEPEKKQVKEPEKKQKPKSPPKEIVQANDVVSPKARFIKGQKREELNMILKEYHSEIAAEMTLIQKDVQLEAKDAALRQRSPSPGLQKDRHNIFESRLQNSMEKFGFTKFGQTKRRGQSATIRSASLNMSALRLPNDQQSTKVNTRMQSTNQNESAFEHNDLMVFDFSTPNTSQNPFQSRAFNLRIGTPSRNASLAYPLDPTSQTSQNPLTQAQTPVQKTNLTASMNKSHTQENMHPASFQQSKRAAPSNLEVQIGNFAPNSNFPVISNKAAGAENTPASENAQPLHRTSQFKGTTVLMMASRPSSAATNATKKSKNPTHSFQGNGVFPMKIKMRKATETQDSDLFFKAYEDSTKLDDKTQARPRSASFFASKAANRSELNLRLPLDQVIGGRKYSEGKMELLANQLHQITRPSKHKPHIDIKLIESQIKNRVLDLSLSSASDLEEILSENGSEPHLKINYSSSKILDSLVKNHPSHSYQKKRISQGLSNYLKESTLKDLQAYRVDQKGNSPRRNANTHLEPDNAEGKDPLPTPGFDHSHSNYLMPIIRADSAPNSRHSSIQEPRHSIAQPHPSHFKSKAINTLADFRNIEMQAAKRIQRYYRSYKKWGNKKLERRLSSIPFFDTGDGALDQHFQKESIAITAGQRFTLETVANIPLASLRVIIAAGEAETTAPSAGTQVAWQNNLENQISHLKPSVYDFDLTDFHMQKFSESFDFIRTKKLELDEELLSLHSDRGVDSNTKLQDETSNILSPAGSSIVRSITAPIKLQTKHPRIDLIKTGLMKLNTSDIKYYKNILGQTEFWKVSFMGLEEEGSNKYRVSFKLKSRFASFDFTNTVKYKIAELSMFYTTIWPLVLEAILEEADLLAEKEMLAKSKIDTMVVLPDFRAHERKSKKLSKEEGKKIRLLLCHITARAESELIFYRSKLNKAIVKKARFPNGEVIKRNRDFLKMQKIKYYRALHQLATHLSTYNITHELAALSHHYGLPTQHLELKAMEQESIISIQPHNSPNSQTSLNSQRSLGITRHPTKQAGSLTHLPDEGLKTPNVGFDRKKSFVTHTDQASKGKPKEKIKRKVRRLQTTELPQTVVANLRIKEQKKNLQELSRKSDHHKSLTQYPSLRNIQGLQSSLSAAGTELKLDDLAIYPLKKSTIPNSFLPGEMVLQGVIKQLNEFVVFTIKTAYSEDAFEFINTKSSTFELVCEVERLGTEWISRVPIQLKLMSKNMFNSFVSFDQKDFLINSGFTSLQKKYLLHFLKNNLKVQGSKIVINKEPVNKGFNTLSVLTFDSLCDFHTYMRQYSLEKNYIFEAYDAFVLQQNRRKMRKGTAMTRSRRVIPITMTKLNETEEAESPQLNYGMRILNPKDPDYGNIAYGGDEPFAKSSEVQWLTLYNEIRCTFEKKYYFIIREQQNVLFIRLRFEKISNLDEIVHVCIYQTQAQLCDYATIRDKETIERIIIILQMKGSSKLRYKQILGVFSYYRTLVGNKIAVNEKATLGRFTQKMELLPSNIAQILLASHKERLSKYGLTVESVFTKAHITCLGDCYVTATIYKIREFRGFNDVVCIKFEVQPFVSKTKLYKFLINSNDLQFFLNTQYSAIDKHDHLRVVSIVLSRLWLKRNYLYSSLEIPISNHSSLPNSNRSYSLRNAFESRPEQQKDKEFASFGRFLESRIQEKVPIIQKLRKINGIYFLITVKKHLILNYWAIKVYNPRTCRNYITAFYQSDLFSLNLRFIKKILPEDLRKLEKDPKAMQNYANFCTSYNLMLENQKQMPQKQFQQHISFQELPASNEDEAKIFLERMAEDLLLEVKSPRNGRTLQEKSINPGAMQQKFNYIELKFWENVVDQISVERTMHGISILKVDEFRGVLREYVYRDIVRMSKNEEALVEIFLEHFKHKFEIDKPLEPIPDLNINEYIFFMRVTSIHSMHTYNNKFNFEQAIKLYLEDQKIVQKTLFKKKKLNLAAVRLIGNYMVQKTKQLGPKQPQSPVNHNKQEGVLESTMTPLPYFGLKLNCNFKIQMTIDEQHLFMNKFLIYRSILLLVPLQMVAFVYFKKKKYFTAYIYDNQVSWVLKKKIQMAEVRAFIPYAPDMLRLGLYQELGSRILKAFKNPLIIHSYLNSKTEPLVRKEYD